MSRRLSLLTAAVLTAACTRPSSGVPADDAHPAPDAGADASVSLERRPCFGTCPVYVVTVEGSGAVRFEGRRFVADSGPSTGTIPQARVDSLLTELEQAGFFDLADRYAVGTAGCDRYATDLPTVVTELHLRGRVKRVEHDHGCAGAPEMLDSLEHRIDEAAGVAQWVGR